MKTDPHREEVHTMWDTVQTSRTHLSHDLPCPACGHAAHSYLPCSDSCHCRRRNPLATSSAA